MKEDKQEKVKKSQVAMEEEKILSFWNEKKIFQKVLDRDENNGEFVFYDGPPFATGLPHYGHILAGTIKDVFPRFQSMLGKHVRRQWGWDCHGLPIENLIEKELGLKTKKDIEDLGIGKFNQIAKDSVLRYEVDWSKVVPRAGRWIDMENKYQTMDSEYTESIWWAFKTLSEKDLIYKGYKSMHLCPRCETTLSNFEVNQGYKDVKDISVTIKFELVDEPGTFLLAWTTTPWTLPGNSAVAINPEIEYVKVKTPESNELYIVAKERAKEVFKGEYKIVGDVKTEDLIGKNYKPLFDYYTKEDFDGQRKNAWKVYPADYVTVEDGTGVVHLAPAFGEIDMVLAQKNGIPLIQHVTMGGKMKEEVTDFAGMSVKPKSDDDRERLGTDIEVLRYLQEHGTFFSKENVTHSYPHCWRCDTPLLNYASTSWFVRVPELKDKLLSENAKVSWVPSEIGENRFGKWLEGARDWAVSRTRYWGAPLPVWECESCNERKIFGSMAELCDATKSNNSYMVMRHAESEANTKGLISSVVTNIDHLTDVGKKQAEESGKKLKDKGIDIIISSDFMRTKETAEIVAKEIGLDPKEIIFDERIREIGTGDFEGKTWGEFAAQFSNREERYNDTLENGVETMRSFRKRAASFLFDIDLKYKNKKILIVTHGAIVDSLGTIASMESNNKAKKTFLERNGIVSNAETVDLPFRPFSHNGDFEIDFHKPYIDEVTVPCVCGADMKRVTDVFDCLFESGAMPFAQHHYPFENKDKFDPEKNIGFPADFIAEGLDQTRGWFYTLLVLSVGLFDKSPYKNVIVNGLVLAEDGKKMSKRLKNYPDVNYIFDTYGADSMRFYMMSSPVVRSEDLRFTEKGVDEVAKKIIMRLTNVYSFYEMYRDAEAIPDTKNMSDNVLDKWIVSRLGQVRDEVTNNLLSYQLDRAVRPFYDFIDDLSTWYLRRSRDRFKGDDAEDKQKALQTTRYVLLETVKLLSPFMPFVSESLYQKIKTDTDNESIHMNKWPEKIDWNEDIITHMQEVRRVVTALLELRAKENIKVRQPLSSAQVGSEILVGKDEYVSIIRDEVNLKKVTIVSGNEITLDTVITPELEDEGVFRDLMRSIQEKRKDAGLSPKDIVVIEVNVSEKGKSIAQKFENEIKSVCGVSDIKTNITDGTELFGEITILK